MSINNIPICMKNFIHPSKSPYWR